MMHGTEKSDLPILPEKRANKAGKPVAEFVEGCALQAHEIQLPEMVTVVKPNQQPCTESCVVFGNDHCEA